MERIHPDLYHGTPKADLQAAIQALAASADAKTDDELMVGLLRVVALVSAKGRDGHTGAFIWGLGRYPLHSLPLRLWLFPDGVYVVDALPPYRGLIGSRVTSVNVRAMSEVVAALDPLIPRDNDATVRLLTPRYLLIPEVLRGLGLADRVDRVDLALVDHAGTLSSTPVRSVSMADYNAWAGPYGLHLPQDPGVLYLSRAEEPLWSTVLTDSGTLFVQYDRVDFLDQAAFDDIAAKAGEGSVKRVVVDIRHNYGGEVRAYPQLVDVLASPAIDRAGRLFVITGRNTFSAASMFAAAVEQTTSAVFVGEPMAGATWFYGSETDVPLAASGIVVSVADTYELGARADDQRLTIDPDMPVPLTADDYFAGRDPALAAILAAGERSPLTVASGSVLSPSR